MTLDMLTYIPSPSRGVWHLGPVPIRAYALCIIAGIILALLIGDRRWRARGGQPGVAYDIALWAVPFGLVGGRLYHLLTDWQTYFGDTGVGWEATYRIWDGGLGIWGAVALGALGGWIGCRLRRIPLPAFADAVAPGVILAQAVGRIGNYFNQELYGRETTVPWGLKIFWREDASGIRDPHLLDGVSTGEVYKIVQPTFLYELLWNLLVFGLLLWADRRFRLGHGRLFALYVAAYCVGRFAIELLRDDAATHIAGVRVNSITATFVFIGAVVYLALARRGREDPEVLRLTWQHPSTEITETEADARDGGEDAEEATQEEAEAAKAVADEGGAGDAGAEDDGQALPDDVDEVLTADQAPPSDTGDDPWAESALEDEVADQAQDLVEEETARDTESEGGADEEAVDTDEHDDDEPEQAPEQASQQAEARDDSPAH